MPAVKFKLGAAIPERMIEKGCAVHAGKKVEHDYQGGCFYGEALDAGRCRVNPLKQRIEGKAVSIHNGDFSIEYERFCRQFHCRGLQFRKVARQRLPSLRLDFNFLAVSKYDAAEAIPLRLILPTRSNRDVIN